MQEQVPYHVATGKRTEAIKMAIRDAVNIDITAPERIKHWLRKYDPLLVQSKGVVYAWCTCEMGQARRASNDFDQAMARLKRQARRFRKLIEAARRFKAKPDPIAHVERKKKSPRTCYGCGRGFDDNTSLYDHVYSTFSCIKKHMEGLRELEAMKH